MLPLLPALILLLLQGPAGIERMAGAGQLPSALNALHRHIGAHDQTSGTDEVVLASLFAVSGDQDLSRALLHLLTLVEPEPFEQPARETIVDDQSPPAPTPPSLGALPEGFFACRRSRDGPF